LKESTGGNLVPRKSTTRERLIATAADLFWRQGYAQTGVNEIIRRAGATSGSFYHFFPTKEDLLLAVVDHVAGVFEDEIFSYASDASTDAAERLFAVIDAYRLRLADSGFTFGSPMASLAAEVPDSHPQVHARLVEIQADWTDRLESLVMDLADRLPAAVAPRALASFILSVIEGAALQARIGRSLDAFDAALGELRRHLGLLERPARRAAAAPPPPRPQRPRPRPTTDWRAW